MARRHWIIALTVLLLTQWVAASAQCRALHIKALDAFGPICFAHPSGPDSHPANTSKDDPGASGQDCQACHQLPGLDAATPPVIAVRLQWRVAPQAPWVAQGFIPPARAPPYTAHAPPST